jgi:hypothetical protein
VLVFIKWPFVGMIVETFGFLNLFGCVHLGAWSPCALTVSRAAIFSRLSLPSYGNSHS